jgi:hypothetical protein
MKFWKELADMPLRFNLVLEEGVLKSKIVLLAEKLCHATRFTLERADRPAFGPHAPHIESAFLQGLLEALCLTVLGCHLLCLAVELRTQVIHQDYCVFLLSLTTPIRFIHFKGTKRIMPERGMCR